MGGIGGRRFGSYCINGFVKHGFVINLRGLVLTVELIHLEKREDAFQAFFREYNL